jgi:hypothetical protein
VSETEDALCEETIAILTEAKAEKIRVERDSRGWLVAGVINGSGAAGHTGIDPNTSDDPRDMARRLIENTKPPSAPEPPPPPSPQVPEQSAGSAGEAGPALDVGGAGAADEPAGGAEPPAAVGGPGIMVLPDELGARRNAVVRAITERKLILLDASADKSRRDFLDQAFKDYQNAKALQAPIDVQMEANYADYIALQSRTNTINNSAAERERVALNADLPMLQAIYDALPDWSA